MISVLRKTTSEQFILLRVGVQARSVITTWCHYLIWNASKLALHMDKSQIASEEFGIAKYCI